MFDLIILGLIVHMAGTYMLSIKAGEISSVYKGYYNIPCIFYSSAIFLAVKNSCSFIFKNKIFTDVVMFFKNYTFPIYLLHPFVLNYINPDLKSGFTVFVMPFIIIPVCIFFTYIIRKIPVLKKVLP